MVIQEQTFLSFLFLTPLSSRIEGEKRKKRELREKREKKINERENVERDDYCWLYQMFYFGT